MNKIHNGGEPLPTQELQLTALNENSSLFEIYACGYSKNNAFIAFDAADYLLIYVTKGSGELSVNIRAYSLFAGDFMLCRPSELKAFAPTEGDSTEFFWFSFGGRGLASTLSLLKLTSREKFFIGHDNEVLGMLERTVNEFLGSENFSSVISSALLTAAMAVMSRISSRDRGAQRTKDYDKIVPALHAINSDCTSKLGADEYAKMCNLSTSYFTHLFTKITGYAPMEYKAQQRIGIAKNLLSTTNLSVKEISTIIGFKDPLYFGRCFKQATGMTPSGFRAKK